MNFGHSPTKIVSFNPERKTGLKSMSMDAKTKSILARMEYLVSYSRTKTKNRNKYPATTTTI